MSEPSFEVKIPNIMNPFTVEVNGKTYSFPAGTTQMVNQEVYDVIRNIESMVPTPNPRAGEPSFESLRDRPFGETTEVLFDQRVTFEKVGIDNPICSWGTRGSLPLDYGDEVIVTFEGKTYNATVYGQEGIYAIGTEPSAYGIPFFVSWTPSDNGIFTINSYGPITTDMKIERMVAHTIDPKYLPNGGAGVGYESAEVIFESDVTVPRGDSDAELTQNLPLDVAEGDTLRVTWVDEEYVCTVASAGDEGGIYFGNIGIVGGEDTGEPFLFATLAGTTNTLVVAADGPGMYYVKIAKEQVHTIDPKYLPGKVVYYWDGESMIVTDASGNAITAEQAGKDMFNVVIYNQITSEYYFPYKCYADDSYAAFWFFVNSGSVSVLYAGTVPK